MMPVVLLSIYVMLWWKLGLTSALEIMAIVGTVGALTVGIIKFTIKPKRDCRGLFHSSSNGRYISKNSGYYGYGTAVSALILPLMMKPDLIVNSFPVFTNLPTEMQVIYVVVAHGIGFGLSQ